MTIPNIEIDTIAQVSASDILQYIVDTHKIQTFNLSLSMINSVIDLLVYRKNLNVTKAHHMLNYLIAHPAFDFESFQTAKKRGSVKVERDTAANYQYLYHQRDGQYVKNWTNEELIQLVDQINQFKCD